MIDGHEGTQMRIWKMDGYKEMGQIKGRRNEVQSSIWAKKKGHGKLTVEKSGKAARISKGNPMKGEKQGRRMRINWAAKKCYRESMGRKIK